MPKQVRMRTNVNGDGSCWVHESRGLRDAWFMATVVRRLRVLVSTAMASMIICIYACINIARGRVDSGTGAA